jgi:hypothetical protein
VRFKITRASSSFDCLDAPTDKATCVSDGVWEIELHSLEDLVELAVTEHSIVLYEDGTILIYDGYIE